MKPGRELDALIAEKVMGTHIKFGSMTVKVDLQLAPDDWYITAENMPDHVTPHYSTDIAAAWQVVEKLYQLGWDCDVCLYRSPQGPAYRVDVKQIEHQEIGVTEFAVTAPHAICLAALKAVGVEIR